MQFRVRPKRVRDSFTLPSTLSRSFVRLDHDIIPHDHEHRWLVLTLLEGRHPEMWEMKEIDNPPAVLPADGIVQVKLGEDTVTLQRVGRTFKDAANFYVELNGWEQWSILNVSLVAHPIHLHLIQFQALSRDRYDVTGFDTVAGGTTTPVTRLEAMPLEPGEQGWKDTISVGGGQLVRIAGQFGGAAGRFMYHCHILEHEDEGMMSTFIVMPKEIMKVDPHIDDEHHIALRDG
jgi:o-aminophenol oxidase